MILHNRFSGLGARAQCSCQENFDIVGGVGVGVGGKQFLIVLNKGCIFSPSIGKPGYKKHQNLQNTFPDIPSNGHFGSKLKKNTSIAKSDVLNVENLVILNKPRISICIACIKTKLLVVFF